MGQMLFPGEFESKPTTTYSGGSYGGINGFVESLGEWIEENMSALANNIAMGGYVLVWISFFIQVIAVWINNGFIWALLLGVFGTGLVYYGAAIVMFILMGVMYVVLGAARIVLYNLYTLLIVAVIIAGIIIFNGNNTSINSKQSQKIEVVSQPVTSKYYCTAQSGLNVRYSPNASSKVIGVLQKGKMVDVYEINNGFAKIAYEGKIGYASVKFLKKY